MKIIPAIDIIGGKCVRLSKGDYTTQKVYSENPVDVAKKFEDHGIQYLHLVDLDGAKSNGIVNHKILNGIASQTNLKIDFGGGIKTENDLNIAWDNGAKQVTVGSVAAKNPELFIHWLLKFGSDRIILGADSLNRKIMTSGWYENSDTDVVEFIKRYEENGVTNVICTDIEKDGMLAGTSDELYCEILSKTNVRLIASGGIANLSDVIKMKKIGCSGTIIGKAIYEGKIMLIELKNFIENQ